eukprot:CAMPEP_0171299482 /NCGR_PEP_ID=MMETSP0816-20121228/8316_1 /TAXON_ID=420281 /ORGANISM="Proboscia inermis, Strain CCAP1064/1" /LENGTH=169 /DNA_ID=CAMNT_0011775325 /DNA_START=406 /DNA_END=914 /DNA_ORIENTATION=-
MDECPVAATTYNVSKKDTVSNLEYPDWILNKSSRTREQATQCWGGGRSQTSTCGGRGGRGRGQQARLANQSSQDGFPPEILAPADDVIEISLLGDGTGAGDSTNIITQDTPPAPRTTASWTQVTRGARLAAITRAPLSTLPLVPTFIQDNTLGEWYNLSNDESKLKKYA